MERRQLIAGTHAVCTVGNTIERGRQHRGRRATGKPLYRPTRSRTVVPGLIYVAGHAQDRIPDILSFLRVQPYIGEAFHGLEGPEMTPDDVLKNFERIRDTVQSGWLTTAMEQVESLTTPDDDTFVVQLKASVRPLP